MKNIYKNISKPVRTLLFFALIYFTQINPLNTGHHFHHDDQVRLKNSTGIFTAILKATADHVHFDEQSVPFEHQHKHENIITGKFTKTQIRQNTSNNDTYSTPLHIVLYCKNRASFIRYSELLHIAEHDDSSLIVRGPPLLV